MTTNFPQSGFVTQEGIHNLSPREACEYCIKGAVILDVREDYTSQYKQFGVPVVIQIPLSRLETDWHRVPKDRWIIVADSSGLQSKEGFLLLKEKGYDQISNLAGGLVEWERDGMPLVTDTKEKLTGSCACQLRARNKNSAEDIS